MARPETGPHGAGDIPSRAGCWSHARVNQSSRTFMVDALFLSMYITFSQKCFHEPCVCWEL